MCVRVTGRDYMWCLYPTVCVLACVDQTDSCNSTAIALSCIIHKETERRACYLLLQEQGRDAPSPHRPTQPSAFEYRRESPDPDKA